MLVIPEGVTHIEDRRFKNNPLIRTILLPSTLVSIGESAFEECEYLGAVIFKSPSSLVSIGDSSFRGCRNLKGLFIQSPDSLASVKVIEAHPAYCLADPDNFYKTLGVDDLQFVKIDSLKLKSIGAEAFSGCEMLSCFYIPTTVSHIGTNAFDSCSSLEQVEVEESNPVYDSRGDCNAIIETATNTLVAGCAYTVIPKDVVIIGEGAFSGRKVLPKDIIPNGIKEIRDYAFAGCDTLIIPDSVKNIADNAFHEVSNIIYSGSAQGCPWGATSLNGVVEKKYAHDCTKQKNHHRDPEIKDDDE